jgi:hypothetical protein
MTAAIFGVVGVIVGGLLTDAVEYVFGRMRRAEETRVAARLVLVEFASCITAINQAITNRRWDHVAEGLPTHQWDTDKAILAAAVSTDDWVVVAQGAEGINVLNYAGSGRTFDEGWGEHDWSEPFETAKTKIEAAGKVLRPLAGGNDPRR